MTKEELISIIEKELKENPKASGIEIAKKHKIPLRIAELFKRRLLRG